MTPDVCQLVGVEWTSFSEAAGLVYLVCLHFLHFLFLLLKCELRNLCL